MDHKKEEKPEKRTCNCKHKKTSPRRSIFTLKKSEPNPKYVPRPKKVPENDGKYKGNIVRRRKKIIDNDKNISLENTQNSNENQNTSKDNKESESVNYNSDQNLENSGSSKEYLVTSDNDIVNNTEYLGNCDENQDNFEKNLENCDQNLEKSDENQENSTENQESYDENVDNCDEYCEAHDTGAENYLDNKDFSEEPSAIDDLNESHNFDAGHLGFDEKSELINARNIDTIVGEKGSTMSSGKSRVVLTMVGRKAGVKDIEKSLEADISAIRGKLPPGDLYCICEKFDTYIKGGLFPIMHHSTDSGTINKLMNGGNFLEQDAMGSNHLVEQGVFEEVASIRPGHVSKPESSLVAVAAFKSLEAKHPAVLIENWKNWTGARAFIMDINNAGLQCYKMRFLVRTGPNDLYDEPTGFFYVMITEVCNNEPSDEAMFVDVLQRFRVERWFGYQTIYKKIA